MKTAKLDPAAAERLKMLQLADLGTARREYISTTDGKKVKNIHPDHIEATRISNLAGTEAQQVAQANKARLALWANVYKEIGDTQDLEHLDNLLDGQSHRARLSAMIFASGGQTYSKSASKKDNFLKVAETDYGSKHHGRGSHSAGRGGGVIGTRGRQSATPSPNTTPSRASKQGAVTELGRHIVEAPPGRSRLDPALDSNNNPHKKSQEENAKFKAQSNSGGKKVEKTSLRTRRPIAGDYARILSPPESFLAIARSMLHAKTSDDTPAPASQNPETKPDGPLNESKKPTKDVQVPPEKVPDGPRGRATTRSVAQPRVTPKTPPVHSPATPRAKVSSTSVSSASTHAKGTILKADAPSASAPSANTPTKGPTPKKNISATSMPSTNASAKGAVPKASASAASVASADVCVKGKDSEPTISGHPEKKPSASGMISKQVANAESHTTKKPTGQSQPSALQDATTFETESKPIVKTESEPIVETTEELLLDFGTTPPDPSPLNDFMTSPAIQDLKGIDFRHSSDSSSVHGSTTLEFTGSPKPEQPSNGRTIADYQREISLLSALLESTTLGDLGEGFCERLKQCKKELEELCQAQRNSTESSAGNTPVKHERLPSMSPIENASAQRLRQAVTASPFYPRTSSFSGYRSPTNSISSDSTVPLSTPVPIPAAISIRSPPPPAESESASEHIFGDHLLPGRRSRTASSLRSISSTSQSDEPSTAKVSFSIPSRGSVLKNLDVPDFESNDEKPFTQPEASRNVPLPQITEPKSRDCSVSPASGNQDATLEVPKNRPTHVASNVQKPAVSSLQQSIHALQPPTQTDARNNPSSSQKTGFVARVSSAAQATSVPSRSPSITTIPKVVEQKEKPSSLSQYIHAPKEPTRQPAQVSSLGQSIHAAPAPKEVPSQRQPVPVSSNVAPKVGSTVKSAECSVHAAPTKARTLSGLMSSRYAAIED